MCNKSCNSDTTVQGVANAVGAALGTVGGTCDLVMNLGPIKQVLKMSGGKASDGVKLEHSAREVALERGRELARAEVIKKKGCYNSDLGGNGPPSFS